MILHEFFEHTFYLGREIPIGITIFWWKSISDCQSSETFALTVPLRRSVVDFPSFIISWRKNICQHAPWAIALVYIHLPSHKQVIKDLWKKTVRLAATLKGQCAPQASISFILVPALLVIWWSVVNSKGFLLFKLQAETLNFVLT